MAQELAALALACSLPLDAAGKPCFFRLQRPAYSGWSTIVRQVALTYTASLVVDLAA